MLHHAGRYAWNLHDSSLRPSLLGRAAGRKANTFKNPVEPDDVEEAPRSRETDAKVHTALDTLARGDVGELARSIGDVIHSWRADNAFGGRGVFEHLPLPDNLANEMARYFDEMDEREKQPAFDNVISHLDPSMRRHVAQQVAGWMGRAGLSNGEPSEPVGESALQRPGHAVARSIDDEDRFGRLLPEAGRPTAPVRGLRGVEDEPGEQAAFQPVAAARGPREQQAASAPAAPIPEERRAKFAGGKVVPGPKGPTRTYRMGNRAVQVPSGQYENDMVAGMNYVANSGPNAPAAFMNDKNGDGVIALDQFGRPMRRRGAPIRYSWEQLRQFGALEKARRGHGWPPSEKGMEVRWDDKPSEEANLPPFWPAAQFKYRWGDGSDAVIDPDEWDIEEDRGEFADRAQQAADRAPDYKTTLADAIDAAAKTGKPQPINILLITEGTPINARGQVMGYYGLRVRGYVIVRNGRYMIVGEAVVEDDGDFNYDLDHWDRRSPLGKALLIGTRFVPDPTSPAWLLGGFPPRVPISHPGASYKIRANRRARVRIWGTVPSTRRGR